jgi:hypothetical protein
VPKKREKEGNSQSGLKHDLMSPGLQSIGRKGLSVQRERSMRMGHTEMQFAEPACLSALQPEDDDLMRMD